MAGIGQLGDILTRIDILLDQLHLVVTEDRDEPDWHPPFRELIVLVKP